MADTDRERDETDTGKTSGRSSERCVAVQLGVNQS